MSSLVSSIVQAPDTWRALDVDEDEVYALQEMRDFDEPAADYIGEMDADDLRDYLDSQSVDFDPAADVATLRRAAIGAMQEQGAAEFCDEFSIDPHLKAKCSNTGLCPTISRANLRHTGIRSRAIFSG